MKKLLAALIVALASASAATPATACGDVHVRATVHEEATGTWYQLEQKDGHLALTLAYPKFAVSGTMTYIDTFEVVADRNLRALEGAAAHRKSPYLEVTVRQGADGRWRVVSWKSRT